MQIGQIVLTLVPILHPSADDILVTGNPYGRIKAVLVKQEFVNMEQSILYIAARVLLPLPKYNTYQNAYMADYCLQVN